MSSDDKSFDTRQDRPVDERDRASLWADLYQALDTADAARAEALVAQLKAPAVTPTAPASSEAPPSEVKAEEPKPSDTAANDLQFRSGQRAAFALREAMTGRPSAVLTRTSEVVDLAAARLANDEPTRSVFGKRIEAPKDAETALLPSNAEDMSSAPRDVQPVAARPESLFERARRMARMQALIDTAAAEPAAAAAPTTVPSALEGSRIQWIPFPADMLGEKTASAADATASKAPEAVHSTEPVEVGAIDAPEPAVAPKLFKPAPMPAHMLVHGIPQAKIIRYAADDFRWMVEQGASAPAAPMVAANDSAPHQAAANDQPAAAVAAASAPTPLPLWKGGLWSLAAVFAAVGGALGLTVLLDKVR